VFLDDLLIDTDDYFLAKLIKFKNDIVE